MSTDPWGQEIDEGSTGYHGIFAVSRPLDGDQVKSAIELNRFIVIRVGSKDYLLEIDHIREIIMLPRITFVPNGPRYVEGVINLRGTILPVLNLKKMLGENRSDPTMNTRVLICGDKETSSKTGLLVDSISVVVALSKDDIDTSSPPLAASGHDLLEAMSKRGKNLCGVISLSKVLNLASQDCKISSSIADNEDTQHSA